MCFSYLSEENSQAMAEERSPVRAKFPVYAACMTIVAEVENLMDVQFAAMKAGGDEVALVKHITEINQIIADYVKAGGVDEEDKVFTLIKLLGYNYEVKMDYMMEDDDVFPESYHPLCFDEKTKERRPARLPEHVADAMKKMTVTFDVFYVAIGPFLRNKKLTYLRSTALHPCNNWMADQLVDPSRNRIGSCKYAACAYKLLPAKLCYWFFTIGACVNEVAGQECTSAHIAEIEFTAGKPKDTKSKAPTVPIYMVIAKKKNRYADRAEDVEVVADPALDEGEQAEAVASANHIAAKLRERAFNNQRAHGNRSTHYDKMSSSDSRGAAKAEYLQHRYGRTEAAPSKFLPAKQTGEKRRR